MVSNSLSILSVAILTTESNWMFQWEPEAGYPRPALGPKGAGSLLARGPR